MATLEEVTHALTDVWSIIRDREFARTLDFADIGERRLLPYVGMFLAGRFPYMVSREHAAALPGFGTGRGRLDYLVGGVALELAVRKSGQSTSKLFPRENTTEVRKLLKYEGLAILALFDFAPTPVDTDALDRQYRDWRNECGIGKGKHHLAAFNVRYFYTEGGVPQAPIGFNIRV